MGLVHGYTNDVFISYSHIDNQAFGDPGGGWVDIFHSHLQNFVNVHVGRRTDVWRDRRLTGAEVFAAEIEQQLQRSAVLISVVSPGYVQSEWCNRELVAFTNAAQSRGDLRVGNLQRVVKVLRLPVERSALPALLDEALGAQFYRVDPASGRARDLLLDPASDALQLFRARVDDVAQDLARLLTAMASHSGPETASTETTNGAASSSLPAGETKAEIVFLAWTTGDLNEEREKLRRELEARRYRVLPSGAPPIEAEGVRERVIAALREARVAIHLIGAHYGFVPEGDDRSILELQADDATYKVAESRAARVFWLAPGTPGDPPTDPRLKALLTRVQQPSPQSGRAADVLANQTIEVLKTLVLDRLAQAAQAAQAAKPAAANAPAVAPASARVYLICDERDHSDITPLQDCLFDQGLEVRLPLFEGDAEQIRTEHFETLKESDGVLIHWGHGNEGWVRAMARDMSKVFGLGRQAPFKAATLYLAAPSERSKDSFRTRELAIVRAPDPASPAALTAALRPFVLQVTGGGA